MVDLLEDLASHPDDVELRLVIADRLQVAGDPRGELIAVSCALAAARDPEERALLRAREATLVRSVLPELDPSVVELEWRLGFVRVATVLDRAGELVPALLAHPAARLVEELVVAVEAEELGALGALLEARPRPSLLRRVSAGPPTPDRRWIERAEPAWVEPLAAAAPGLEIRPVMHVSQAEFEAQLEADPTEQEGDLRIMQIAPWNKDWQYGAELQVRAGCHEALAAHATFAERMQRTVSYEPEARRVRVCARFEGAEYPSLYRAIRAIAPFVEDARFTIRNYDSTAIDELAIAGRELRFVRRFAEATLTDVEYWHGQVAERLRDEELRRFVVQLYAKDAIISLEDAECRAPPGPGADCDDARRALDHALSLDDRDPELWQLRGRCFRAIGELGEAERCYLRAHELEGTPVASFDLALVAFAAGRDATARERVERVVAASPDHTGARLVAGFLASGAGAAEDASAHVAALVRVVERRRAATIISLSTLNSGFFCETLEPSVWQLVQTGRHAELLDWYLVQLASLERGDGGPARGAAMHLLAWAQHFRYWIEQQLEGAAGLAERLYAAAEELDRLAGDVCYARSRFDRSGIPTEERLERERADLERTLAINPDHLDAIADLGALHLGRKEYDRAIELLERYIALFAARFEPGGERGYPWGVRVNQLAVAHYERAYRALYGAPPGVNRPPGHPAEATLARVDATADHVLALLRQISDRSYKELVPSYLMKASVAGSRGQHRDALAWADHALACPDSDLACVEAAFAHAWSMRANAARNLGMLDEAADSARHAIEIEDTDWQPHHVLACVEAKRGGDREVILDRLGRVLELWPEGRPEVAAEPDLASLRDDPTFRALVGVEDHA